MKSKVPHACMMIVFLCLPLVLHAGEKKRRVPRIQVALLLDTSNSMDGLIAQAKTQLWRIVNELATAERKGVKPVFEVALYEYGNNGLPAAGGYIRRVVPLTDDLDLVSEKLFSLRTNGGREYCGRVIAAAVEELSWSTSPRDLKTIFIAGNEPFTQGNVDYKEAVRKALRKGITVNTIFCGPYRQGVSGGWKDGAERGDGTYMNINQDKKSVHVAAPQDAEILRLGRELNATYVGFGRKGAECKERQEKQDRAAAAAAREAGIQRMVAKSSSLYRAAGWDLVDAVEAGKVDLAAMKEEELPPEMRGMSPAERKAYVEKLKAKRRQIRKRIQELNRERGKFIARKMKEAGLDETDTLQAAVILSLRKLAAAKDFTLREPSSPREGNTE